MYLDFMTIKNAVQDQLSVMSGYGLFSTDIDKDFLWELYLSSFPEGTNPILNERTEHDCQCCKQFIRTIGGVVSIIDSKIVTIWDFELDNAYGVVAKALSDYVKSKAVNNLFYHYEARVGTDHNYAQGDGEVIKWGHFYYQLPARFVLNKGAIGTKLSLSRADYDVFKRGLDEINMYAIDTVLELIADDNLYRGAEHKTSIQEFKKFKLEYDEVPNEDKSNWCWAKVALIGPKGRIRNNVEGTLLVDLSNDMDLNEAVKKFETKKAPENYQRPKALVTRGMIEKAQKRVIELGYEDSLERRPAVSTDITVNNVIYADRTAKKKMLNVFDEMVAEVNEKVQSFDKVQEVTVDHFLNDVLPTAKSVEMLMENRHTSNLMSLVAPVNADAKCMLKWGNNFSWDYNGGMADSDLRRQVADRGGRVDGVLRFSHTWNYDSSRPNQSLMDLHVFINCDHHSKELRQSNDQYPDGNRVGWNNRIDGKTGGTQDVDFTHKPGSQVPVENITFPTLGRMPDGKYTMKLHNWELRAPTKSGAKCEIEFDGNIYQYEVLEPLGHKEWVTVAVVTKEGNAFTIDHKLPLASTQVREEWGLSTQKFHKVDMIMNSPNHWDGEETGNKHVFFILDGCKNPDKMRGFYNEYLDPNLKSERKVFEMLGNKMKAEPTDEQLSGLGFSSTVRNDIVVRVTGTNKRVLRIKF